MCAFRWNATSCRMFTSESRARPERGCRADRTHRAAWKRDGGEHELVKVADGSHLWGRQYQRDAADTLALQQEIGGDMSQKLQPSLSGEQKEKLARLPTQNQQAYQLYVKGRYFQDRWEAGQTGSVQWNSFGKRSPAIRLLRTHIPAWLRLLRVAGVLW